VSKLHLFSFIKCNDDFVFLLIQVSRTSENKEITDIKSHAQLYRSEIPYHVRICNVSLSACSNLRVVETNIGSSHT